MVASPLGHFLLLDLQDLDLALAVILLVDSGRTGVPAIVPSLAKVEGETGMKSEIGVELLGDTVLHTGLVVEIGLIEESTGLEVK